MRALWLLAALGLASAAAWSAAERSFAGLWLTPEQQGARLLAQRQYAEAARRFRDPVRQGVALYRGGDFKGAAAAFARADTAEAAFDRGNALVMLGKYPEAIASYERALVLRPGWDAAVANRQLATIRRDRLAGAGGADEGTEGEVAPDDIVFDERAKQAGAKDVEVVTGGVLSDDQVQAVWLRRVQTRPADFLRAKFAYQESRRARAAMP